MIKLRKYLFAFIGFVILDLLDVWYSKMHPTSSQLMWSFVVCFVSYLVIVISLNNWLDRRF